MDSLRADVRAGPRSCGDAPVVRLAAEVHGEVHRLHELGARQNLKCRGSARLMHGSPARAWTPQRLARGADLPESRAAAALAVLSRAKLVQAVDFAMNFSGEPHYRCIAAGARAGSHVRAK